MKYNPVDWRSIDLFKNVNDHYGHQVGDHVLREVAALIQASSRTCDIPARIDQRTFAARYGGEEFVVILPESPLEGGGGGMSVTV